MAKGKFILAFFIAIMLISCARFAVKVDAYGNDSYLNSKKYILAKGASTLDENDIQYIEFSDYVKKTLYAKGYIETANYDEADLVVFFRYGISDPETFQETYSVPVWGQTTISSINTTSYAQGSAYGIGNTVYGSATGNSTSRVNYNYGVTGYRQETQTYTQYFRYLMLDVYDLNIYRSTGNPKMVWKTVLTSNGSSGDLRLVIPHMIAVGSPYFGKNSGTKQTLNIFENDKRVKQLKGIE